MSSLQAAMAEEGTGYEVPARLMSKDDVEQICGIMGLSRDSISNFEPLPEPPKFGAGRVNPFSADNKASFVEPKEPEATEEHELLQRIAEHSDDYEPPTTTGGKVPRLDLDNIIPNLFLSRYKFIPPFLELYHKVGTQKRDRAGKELSMFPNTAHGFSLTPEAIKRRAAWAWHRTYMLCQRAAQNIESRGPRQRALGLATMGNGAQTAFTEAISKLRMKASKARAHALKLYPKLDEEQGKQEQAVWGSRLTLYKQYYEEMADNYDRVTRFEVAQKYKGTAMTYLCEAISLYLEWKQKNPAKATVFSAAPKAANLSTDTPYFGGAGSIAKLWAEAAKWSQHPDTDLFWSKRFREWWLRAVMARGHAEWLVMELDESDPNTSAKRRPAGELRLLPPAPVGCYVNDCVIRSSLIVLGRSGVDAPWPFYDDDEWHTEYIKIQMESREWAWVTQGDRNYNFAPSAPDFVFLEKAKKGWARTHLGMFPIDGSILAINTGYYDRYCRQGLASFIPKSSTPYERALAVCADDIILEWEQNRYVDILSLPNNEGDNILADLESDVTQLAWARRCLTAAETRHHGFQRRLEGRLKHHLDSIGALFQTRRMRDLEESAKLIFLLRVEKLLRGMLGPWYSIAILQPLTDEAPFHLLGPAEMGDKIPLTQEQAAKLMSSTVLHIMITYWQLKRVFKTLEKYRAALVSGKSLDDEEYHFVSVFRAYLETGDEAKLPFVKSGLDLERELTVEEFRRRRVFSCGGDCGCAFDKAEEAELAKARRQKQAFGPARDEKERIKRAFAARDRESAAGRPRPTPDVASQRRAQALLEMLVSLDLDSDMLPDVRLYLDNEEQRVLDSRRVVEVEDSSDDELSSPASPIGQYTEPGNSRVTSWSTPPQPSRLSGYSSPPAALSFRMSSRSAAAAQSSPAPKQNAATPVDSKMPTDSGPTSSRRAESPARSPTKRGLLSKLFRKKPER